MAPRRLVCCLVLTSISLLHGGSPVPIAPESAPLPKPEPEPWLTPTLDFRLRYEWRNVNPAEDAQALTARARFGLLTGEWAGFQAFGELEATHALVDDYRSNPADDSTKPFVPANTVISDPENFELNQAWLSYRFRDFVWKAGRQRIVRNNAAFIANVGWRQNEQTYDAAQLEYAGDPFRFSYAYANRALRIFGDDANDAPPGAPLRDFEGDFHLLDAAYEGEAFVLGSYAYLIDVDNSAAVGLSQTLGAFWEHRGLRLEGAYQDGDSALGSGEDYGAWYGHASFAAPAADATWTVGVEYLEKAFKTPFALLHAFNGFADVFASPRSGVDDSAGAYHGLTDAYVSWVRPGLPWNLEARAYLHAFFDDALSETYGYEADAVLVKSLGKGLTAILKGAWFFADDGSGFPDAAQVSAEVNFTF